MVITIITNICFAGGDGCPEPTVVYKERIVYVDRIQEVPIEIQKDVTKKNRLSLMLADGPSDKVSLTTTSTSATIKHESDTLLGVQYQRDFNRLTLGVFGLSNDTVGVSVGVSY